VSALAAFRLYLYCNKEAGNPTMNLWSTLVTTQLQIFTAHTCTTIFVVVKKMSGMTAHFGLGNQAITSGSADTHHPRTPRSSDRLASSRRRVSGEVQSDEDETVGGDGESQRQIMRTFEYKVTRDIEGGRAEVTDQW
jgi:hypothetical protein